MNANLDTIFKTPWTYFAIAVGIFTSFFTALITQIKEKLFLIKLVINKCSLLMEHDATIDDTFLFVSNGLSGKK